MEFCHMQSGQSKGGVSLVLGLGHTVESPGEPC
jgi:hypothetical protein